MTVPKKPYKILIAEFIISDIVTEIPYLFSKVGCTVEVFCPKESFLLKNKYWSNWLESPYSSKEFSEKLQKVVTENSYDWIILANDQTIRLINESISDDLLARKILPLSKLENRYMLGSKAGLSRICNENNILTPKYISCESSVDIENAPLELFPALLKMDRSEGGNGVFLCEDKPMALDKMKNLSVEERKGLILQKYIPGDNIAVEALYKNGKLLAYSYSKVIQTTNGEFSPSITRSYSSCPKIEDSLIKIGEVVGFNGFNNMTFMRTGEKHFLIEADPRPQSWFRLGEFGGMDFSLAIENYLMDRYELMRPDIPLKTSDITVRHFFREINYFLHNADFLNLSKWVFNNDGRWRFIPWYDFKVLGTMSKILIHNCLQGLIKRVRLQNLSRLLLKGRSRTLVIHEKINGRKMPKVSSPYAPETEDENNLFSKTF